MKERKKPFDYFECLVDMSLYALEEARQLKEMLDRFDPEELGERRASVHALEHKCDLEKHGLTEALVREFLPPVDREDLSRLAHVTDDLTDSVESVVAFFYMADIRLLREGIGAFAGLVIECCENVVGLMKEFRNFKKSQRLSRYIVRLNDLEEKGDKMYAEAMRQLSRTARTTRELIEWRDVYKSFENCFDAAESVADNVESVVLKNT